MPKRSTRGTKVFPEIEVFHAAVLCELLSIDMGSPVLRKVTAAAVSHPLLTPMHGHRRRKAMEFRRSFGGLIDAVRGVAVGERWGLTIWQDKPGRSIPAQVTAAFGWLGAPQADGSEVAAILGRKPEPAPRSSRTERPVQCNPRKAEGLAMSIWSRLNPFNRQAPQKLDKRHIEAAYGGGAARLVPGTSAAPGRRRWPRLGRCGRARGTRRRTTATSRTASRHWWARLWAPGSRRRVRIPTPRFARTSMPPSTPSQSAPTPRDAPISAGSWRRWRAPASSTARRSHLSRSTEYGLIPAEMVDEFLTRDLPGGAYVAAGIEFDTLGRRAAYYVLPVRPTDVYATARDPIRVPAEDVLHLMRPLGPGQVRGVSWLAPVLLTLAELDSLLDALLVGAKIAACHAGFISNLNEIGGSAFEDADADGDVSLEPGIVRRLSPGEQITFNSPTEAKDSIGFAKLTLGQIAAGLGVPQHLLDGDLSGANYSSLRAGLLPFRQKVEQFQYHCLVPQVLAPLWRRVITREYLAERLDLPDLAPAFAVEWLMPRPMQVDPLKDTQAIGEMIDRGLASRRQAVASLGWNVAELDAEIAADRERESDLGLAFSTGGADAA